MEERTYRIGEAAKLLNLKTYVLRFWETEFSQLQPHRTDKGQRLYSEQDLAMLGTIQHLLHERGLTIEGARKILAEQKDVHAPLVDGDSFSPEAIVPEMTKPLYSEALTEAVISALQRTGQNGFAAALDTAAESDADEALHDSQSIEALVARVIAAGQGVPPQSENGPETFATVRPASIFSSQNTPQTPQASAPAAEGTLLSLLPPSPAQQPEDGCMAVVREAIAELETLRDMLSPRRFR